MEIQFRPMSASTLAREVRSGQTPTEDGQSFVEVVESLTATDQTPEKDADAGGAHEQRTQNRSPGAAHAPVHSAPEPPADEIPESSPAEPESQSRSDIDSRNKFLGSHLDVTA